MASLSLLHFLIIKVIRLDFQDAVWRFELWAEELAVRKSKSAGPRSGSRRRTYCKYEQRIGYSKAKSRFHSTSSFFLGLFTYDILWYNNQKYRG